MNSRLFYCWTGLAALLVLEATGCDEYYTGMGEKALMLPADESIDRNQNGNNNSNGNGADSGTADSEDALTTDITGYGYKLDTLLVTAPLSGDNAAMLNEFFSESIRDNTMNILMQVIEIGTEDGDGESNKGREAKAEADSDLKSANSMLLQTGSGEYKADENRYATKGETSLIPCQLDGLTFTTTTPSDLPFNLSGLSTPLLVEQLDINGTFASDGRQISTGSLVGILSVETAETVDMGGMSLKILLQLVNAAPDLDLDQDGTMDAWHFEGDYSAARVNMAP